MEDKRLALYLPLCIFNFAFYTPRPSLTHPALTFIIFVSVWSAEVCLYVRVFI
jgi:hypothetical protein